MTTLDQLIAGIRQVESGGNYGVVNSIGAVGAYQVMKGNVPSWTRQALGYSLTWQQYRDDPAAQDSVAQYMLGRYYAKYGAAGAAAMWFSGQPNPDSTASDGSNSVRQYVDKVLGAAGSASTSTYSAATVTPKLDNETMAQMYGLTYAEIKGNRDLSRLFSQAVAGSWSADRFTAELKSTSWWRTTSNSARQYFLLKSGDPATYAQKYQAAAYHINDLATKLGVRNLLGKGTTPGHIDSFLDRVVQYQMRDGWTDARIQDYLGNYVGAGGIYGGQAGGDFDALNNYAFANGLKQAPTWYKSTIRAIESGRSTLETETAKLRKQAAAKYSMYSQQIMAGQNAIDLAAPYIQSVSNILEQPSTGIDLGNKYVAKAMSAKSPDGSPYSIWQFENDLRSDPTWVKTNNARESMMSVAHGVLKDFGMSF